MTYNTDRKNEIIALLSAESERAFTTEEICTRLLDGGGKSTVYRIISELTQSGVIKKIADPKSRRVRYQYFGKKECSEHLHLKCRSCERLIHLDKKSSQAIIDCLNIGGSFTLDTTEILSGQCKNCKGKVI